MFKLYSSENMDPKMLRKMLTGGLLQSCMHILIIICISTITKGLLVGVKLRLCGSFCIYYKLLMQLAWISVLCYILICFFGSNHADFIHIASTAFVC